jgi:orotate phosphoribosyltransferase
MTPTDANLSDLERAVLASRGHFCYESGHHGDLWLDLDKLFVDARRIRAWAATLAQRVTACRPEVICGPLTGGAFVAQLLAAEIGAEFVFAERHVSATNLVHYHIPESLRAVLPGRRVLLVDDAINAGSAVQATLVDLQACDSELVGIACLLALGQAAAQIARQHGAQFFTLVSLERGMWPAEVCPLCDAGVPLTNLLVH